MHLKPFVWVHLHVGLRVALHNFERKKKPSVVSFPFQIHCIHYLTSELPPDGIVHGCPFPAQAV